jgi:predicted nucleic acid-binding Zn ribbon protein
MAVLTRHSHCDACGGDMPKHARFGQRYCSPGCRAAGKAEEERVARRLWREAGRPTEFEGRIDLVALGLVAKPAAVRRRKLPEQQTRERQA